jgi:hypothetical protein
MSCAQCGAPAQGGLCKACELAQANEKKWGVPEDHIDDGEEADD